MKPSTLFGPGIAMIGITYGLARYSYGLFLPDMRAEFDLSLGILGAIASSSYLSYMLAALIVPFLITQFGPKFPIILGGICAVAGMGLIGLAESPWTLLAGVAIAGASPGFAYPPLSDVVSLLIEERMQNRTLSYINSGTSYGVLLAGALALFAAGSWRVAWIAFACISVGVTLWISRVLPAIKKKEDAKKEKSMRNKAIFRQYQVRILFLFSFVIGLATSVYWTFAVDLITQQAAFSSSIGKVFWILVGVSGVIGASAGKLINRYGLEKVLKGSILGLAVSTAILPVAFDWTFISVSAILFGTIFIIITGVFGVWCLQISPENPSVCFGPSLFLISAGQFIGPVLMGLVGEWLQLSLTFYVSVCIMVALLPIKMRARKLVLHESVQ